MIPQSRITILNHDFATIIQSCIFDSHYCVSSFWNQCCRLSFATLHRCFLSLFLFGCTRIVFIPRMGVRFREGWCGAGTCGCEGRAVPRTWSPSPSPPPVLLPSHYIKQWGDGYRFRRRRLITSHPRNMVGSQYRQQRIEIFLWHSMGNKRKISIAPQWRYKKEKPEIPFYTKFAQPLEQTDSIPTRKLLKSPIFNSGLKAMLFFSLDQSNCNVL